MSISIGINPTDLGITPTNTPAPNTNARQEAQPNKATGALEPGSTLARSLYEVWSGRRVTVIDSPPGAGKTTLVVELVTRLARSGIRAWIITPTNAAGAAVADKIEAAGTPVSASGGIKALRDTATKHVTGDGVPAQVSTIASAGMRTGVDVDVMIVDEAYQATMSAVLQAVDSAPQLVLVGDPGQIGPVVTSSTAPWDHLGDAAPHSPAPYMFASRDDAITLRLPATYRLGAETVDLIAPLYDFTFNSRRPPHVMTDRAGRTVPELSRLEVPDSEIAHDSVVMRAAVTRAVALVGTTVAGPDGNVTVGTSDVAVVVSHNSQRAAVESMLNAHPDDVRTSDTGITVGTADSLQGGQWLAVVAVDPMIGHSTATEHSISTGRLCVMLSRHVAHLTWVHGSQWQDTLSDDETVLDVRERGLGLKVRERLVAKPEAHS